MPRLPVPELEDYPWWPAPLRDAMTGFLRSASETLRISAVAAPLLDDVLRASGQRRIIDLCSGGGGPAVSAVKRLRARFGRDVALVLTDKFPNATAFAQAERELPGHVVGVREPIDATAVPADLDGVRTIFNALHHLPPAVARAVLADAAEKGQPIISFEFVERGVQGLALISFLPLAVFALTPFSKPTVTTLALTYLVPIVPLATWWDGFASCFRAYTVAELEAMVAPLSNAQYQFRVARRRVPFSPLFLTTVTGLPINESRAV